MENKAFPGTRSAFSCQRCTPAAMSEQVAETRRSLGIIYFSLVTQERFNHVKEIRNRLLFFFLLTLGVISHLKNRV